MSIAEDIHTYLAIENSYIGVEPQGPINCITFYDTGGPMQNAKFALDDLNFQVRSRHTNYKDGIDALESVKLRLDGIGEFVSSTHKYLGIWCMTAPMFIGRDTEQSPLFTANFRTMREPLTDALRGARTALSN